MLAESAKLSAIERLISVLSALRMALFAPIRTPLERGEDLLS
jgi:hypothetical protein